MKDTLHISVISLEFGRKRKTRTLCGRRLKQAIGYLFWDGNLFRRTNCCRTCKRIFKKLFS